ncbi:MAG: homocysteine S-methyltransferase family protein [Candidatus Nanopelagicales bacterium]
MHRIFELLDSGKTLIGDGAMGTLLQEKGLTDGGAPELWNVEKPEIIEEIFDKYAKAGANFLTTNTFGGSAPRLQMHSLEDRLFELNKAASEIAKKVSSKYPDVFVMGDVGPTGELMEPMGTLTVAGAKEIFTEQIKALLAGGADGILIETMSDLSEVQAAVQAVQEIDPEIPIIVMLSFDTNLRTMMGVKPAQAITEISKMGVKIIGANCGRGTDEIRVIAKEMSENKIEGVYLITQSNAGLPKLVGADFVYDGTPEEMAKYAVDMKNLGINIIGACCGSTPEHIAAIRNAVSP